MTTETARVEAFSDGCFRCRHHLADSGDQGARLRAATWAPNSCSNGRPTSHSSSASLSSASCGSTTTASSPISGRAMTCCWFSIFALMFSAVVVPFHDRVAGCPSRASRRPHRVGCLQRCLFGASRFSLTYCCGDMLLRVTDTCWRPDVDREVRPKRSRGNTTVGPRAYMIAIALAWIQHHRQLVDKLGFGDFLRPAASTMPSNYCRYRKARVIMKAAVLTKPAPIVDRPLHIRTGSAATTGSRTSFAESPRLRGLPHRSAHHRRRVAA